MSNRISRKFVVAAALLAACIAVPAMAEPNPQYESWAKFKPGATTTVKGSTEAMGQKTSQTITTKLVDVQPDKVTVETTISMEVMGQKMPGNTTKQEIPKELPKPAAAPGAPADAAAKTPEIKKGTETVTVMGKSFNCDTQEVTTEQNGMKVTAKTWMSADVPGMVKMTSSTSGAMASTTTMELVEFKDGQ